MKGGKMWIKRSTYEKLQDEYDKLQISNLLLGKRLIDIYILRIAH